MLSPGDDTVPARSTQRPPTLRWPIFIGNAGSVPGIMRSIILTSRQIRLPSSCTRHVDLTKINDAYTAPITFDMSTGTAVLSAGSRAPIVFQISLLPRRLSSAVPANPRTTTHAYLRSFPKRSHCVQERANLAAS